MPASHVLMGRGDRWGGNTVYSTKCNTCCSRDVSIGPVGGVLKGTNFMRKSNIDFGMDRLNIEHRGARSGLWAWVGNRGFRAGSMCIRSR